MARKIFGQDIAVLALNIGWVFLIISIITCIVAIVKIVTSSQGADIGTLVHSIIMILAYICLILGIQQNQPKYFIPYLILGFIAIVVTIANIVMSAGVTLTWILLVLNIFFWVIVFLLYKDMTEGTISIPEIH